MTAETLRISVVVAVVGAVDGLLEALAAQETDVPFEVLLSPRRILDPAELPWEEGPERPLRLLPAAPGLPIPALRHRAVREARHPIVAVLDDVGRPDRRWVDRIATAFAAGARVVGGSMDVSDEARAVDRAVLFLEYAAFVPPLATGPGTSLPGNNAAYDRDLLLGVLDDDPGLPDVLLHRRLRERGEVLVRDPSLRVVRDERVGTWSCAARRFRESRRFAARRLDGISPVLRVLYGLAAVALPALLLARTLRSLARRPRTWRPWLAVLPWTALFLASWTAGEMTGALAGDPGGGQRDRTGEAP